MRWKCSDKKSGHGYDSGFTHNTQRVTMDNTNGYNTTIVNTKTIMIAIAKR